MAGQVLLVIFLSVVDVLALSTLRSTWNGQGLPAFERRVRALWVWGEPALQGFVRASPVGIVTSTAVTVAAGGTIVFTAYQPTTLGTLSAFVALGASIVAIV